MQRWLKLSRYLADLDLDVHVLTVDPATATYPLTDKSLLREVGQKLTVHYSKTSELFSLYKKTSGRKEVPFSGFANESDKPGIRQKLARFARGNFFLPDARKAWNRFAIKKALEVISRYGIPTIITTSPPHSTQLIGLRLKKTLNIQWLADFRDPWTDIYYYNKMYPTPIARDFDRKLERRVLEHADKVITVSDDLKSLLLTKSSELDPRKFKVVPNGFDPADFEGLTKSRTSKKATILYAGTLTDQYPVEAFLSSLQSSEFSEKLSLKFIGRQDENSRNLLRRFSSGLDIEVRGYIPKSEINAELINADILLLVIPEIENNKGILTGKLFDYLGSGKPVLCIGPTDGDAARILEEASAGRVFSYADFEGLDGVLHRWLTKDQFSPDANKIQQYSRKLQAADIAKLL
mgnify:FL=1